MAKFQTQLKKIAVYTSGGDAPGMNAAIRAVTRIGINSGLEVVGILGGYSGMLNSQFQALQLRTMANIIQRGGTILKTGRCPEFQKPEARAQAMQNLATEGIQAAVCIGGDGSYAGAHALWAEHQFPIVGVPGTIDNDIFGTDETIGFDTAVNTALQAIDKIRDTADSHDRLFIVEVMGRDSGFIAAAVGLAGGAEEIFAPDFPVPLEKVIEKIKSGQAKGKRSSILITAEGQKPGRAYDLAEQLRKRANLDAKVCILGHQQRGGAPTANDRILASRLGAAAVQHLLLGECDLAMGVQGGKVTAISLEDAFTQVKTTPQEILQLAVSLAT
ncbi:MAG: 6-phosphofructokinase [Bdellovibrio sp.]|jgi:6-phosphofructokinase 1